MITHIRFHGRGDEGVKLASRIETEYRQVLDMLRVAGHAAPEA